MTILKITTETDASRLEPRLPHGTLTRRGLTVEYDVEHTPHMATIQVVLEVELLKAADRVARKRKINRSALFREALRAHLRRLETLDKEARDREGYVRYPDSLDEPAAWDKVADWPDE